jgi:hypothetical protein
VLQDGGCVLFVQRAFDCEGERGPGVDWTRFLLGFALLILASSSSVAITKLQLHGLQDTRGNIAVTSGEGEGMSACEGAGCLRCGGTGIDQGYPYFFLFFVWFGGAILDCRLICVGDGTASALQGS